MYEEIGLKVDFQHLRPHLTINFENGFNDIYLIQEDVELHMLTLQHEEVQNVKWVSKEEILTMIKNEEFLPYYESLIHLLFDCRYKRGTIQR